MTPVGIEPATFRFVAQHLNHCAIAAPSGGRVELYLYPPSGSHRACNGITLPLIQYNTFLELSLKMAL